MLWYKLGQVGHSKKGIKETKDTRYKKRIAQIAHYKKQALE